MDKDKIIANVNDFILSQKRFFDSYSSKRKCRDPKANSIRYVKEYCHFIFEYKSVYNQKKIITAGGDQSCLKF